ncbi:MAG: hypothetical protein ABJA67_03680, partial [Chthonomonadales bacterium]
HFALPIKPIDIGRFDVVFDWETMGSFVLNSWGNATQLDRAMGYEANAQGTSYLGPDPTEFLGTSVAAPQITVTG